MYKRLLQYKMNEFNLNDILTLTLKAYNYTNESFIKNRSYSRNGIKVDQAN